MLPVYHSFPSTALQLFFLAPIFATNFNYHIGSMHQLWLHVPIEVCSKYSLWEFHRPWLDHAIIGTVGYGTPTLLCFSTLYPFTGTEQTFCIHKWLHGRRKYLYGKTFRCNNGYTYTSTLATLKKHHNPVSRLRYHPKQDAKPFVCVLSLFFA